MKKSQLHKIIKEEINLELSEGLKGATIGYIVGVLIDFFIKKKKVKPTIKSKEQLEKELKQKLDAKYNTDPKFKELVDAIAAGQKVIY